ncbi:hypothetical protein E2C01_074642 [Portunus trituberculatus]|uniref:Uncharacterized protein n=1 Tax=Portunus trituberculatus TaxID=210409 RepID=A0A5B7IET9_PORTR|nr:hypothetical protein [Portunus trituberculatus]
MLFPSPHPRPSCRSSRKKGGRSVSEGRRRVIYDEVMGGEKNLDDGMKQSKTCRSEASGGRGNVGGGGGGGRATRRAVHSLLQPAMQNGAWGRDTHGSWRYCTPPAACLIRVEEAGTLQCLSSSPFPSHVIIEIFRVSKAAAGGERVSVPVGGGRVDGRGDYEVTLLGRPWACKHYRRLISMPRTSTNTAGNVRPTSPPPAPPETHHHAARHDAAVSRGSVAGTERLW